MIEFFGLDQKTPINQREDFLRIIKSQPTLDSVIISTCDRIEVYAGEGNINPEIVEHLFSLCSGLKSPLLGENAIQGQVKNAYETARQTGKMSKTLNMLFQHALKCGKKVRHLTQLSRGAMGHGHLAFQIVQKNFTRLQNLKVVVLGVNNLSNNFLSYLKAAGVKICFVSNRSFQKACELAARFDFYAEDYKNLDVIIKQADVLFCCTSAPHFVVDKKHIPKNKELLILDLAVPRDVDPAVQEYPLIKLFNVQDIEKEFCKCHEARKSEAIKAQVIIDKEVAVFYERLYSNKLRITSNN